MGRACRRRSKATGSMETAQSVENTREPTLNAYVRRRCVRDAAVNVGLLMALNVVMWAALVVGFVADAVLSLNRAPVRAMALDWALRGRTELRSAGSDVLLRCAVVAAAVSVGTAAGALRSRCDVAVLGARPGGGWTRDVVADYRRRWGCP